MNYESSLWHRGDDTGEYGEAADYVFGWNEDDDGLENLGESNITRLLIEEKGGDTRAKVVQHKGETGVDTSGR